MKKRFIEEQIITILGEQDAGFAVKEIIERSPLAFEHRSEAIRKNQNM